MLTKEEIIEETNDLLLFDFDALRAYEDAIGEITDTETHKRLIEFRRDHLSHIEELSEIVLILGGRACDRPNGRESWCESLSATLARPAEAVLHMLRATEEVLIAERATRIKKDSLEAIAQVLKRQQKDNQRHRQWFVAVDGRSQSASTAATATMADSHLNPSG